MCLVRGTYDDAQAKAFELQKQTGATFIHPFDDEAVIAGQGTIGLELLEQLPDVEAVVVPIGGGGLISGVAFAVKSLMPQVKVYGVQAERAAGMLESRRAGRPITLQASNTFADGIAVKHPGDLTFQLCQQYVDDIVSVTRRTRSPRRFWPLWKSRSWWPGGGGVRWRRLCFINFPLRAKRRSASSPAATST